MDVTLIADRQPVARKEHQCEWCPAPIEPGLKHEMWRYIDDGSWMTMRMHIECREAFRSSSEPDPGGWTWICTDAHGRGQKCDH